MKPILKLDGSVIFDGDFQIGHIQNGHLIITVGLNFDQFKALNAFVNKIKDKLI